MKAISHVKCLQDFAVIKISLFFVFFLQKIKGYIGFFFVTRCISDHYSVLFHVRDLR